MQTVLASSICVRPKPLIPRGTGSKRLHIPRWKEVLESVSFDTVVEPFGQGLWLSQAFIQGDTQAKTLIAAESLVDVRSIWKTWVTPDWQDEVARHLTAWKSMAIEESWPQISSTWETYQERGVISPVSAAAGLAVRILSFSGICRDSPGSSALNISWNSSQLPRWFPNPDAKSAKRRAGYTPHWPKAPEEFYVYPDYGQVQYPADASRTLSLVDPPYAGDISDPPPSRRSGRYISPAYFGHRPHAQFTYDMAVWSLRAALAAGCRVVIACNYDSERLHHDYLALAQEFGYSCDRTVIGALQSLNNNAKTAQKVTPYLDTYWILRNDRYTD